jgi:serine/threonine protein kinase
MNEEMIKQKKNKLIGTSYYIAPEVLELDYD